MVIQEVFSYVCSIILDREDSDQLYCKSVMSARKFSALISLLVLLWSVWLVGDKTFATAITVRGRCECVNKADSVHPKRIADISVVQKNALCSEIQIILTLEQDKAACLNPDSHQGQRLLDCWRSHKEDTVKIKMCMRKKKTNR
ncbi:hypothetical protein GJAV_G00242970 [Gymnothorax javanicus]|nr:hypothetical protein GJAV_G00242970 [Gymnothorax javanicus]